MLKKQSDIIRRLSDGEMLKQLYFSQILMLVLAMLFGVFLFADAGDFFSLWQLFDLNILTFGIPLAFFVILADLAVMKWVPRHMYDDEGINEKLFRNRSYPHILILTLFIAFTEEILFRGVIQTHFGIWTASIIFAILHFRYLKKWLLFVMVVSISFLLGLSFQQTDNLFVPVTAHFLIDVVFACQIRFLHVRRSSHGGDVQDREEKEETGAGESPG
ncbi:MULTISPECIES: CPBP family intramembrane glutamic endopeptidase [Bacillus]|uniref:CPBP family intramembrane glutamic endopeptidase n=1 Tax=Bacillus TaxID=1386 RepID=UPI000411942E|nr:MULTISPECIES: type II CAAX endopeptidase family protein [Bacillus]QHZ47458.1 CPBP family intramembrane metalloprotease [Bacillus sp. NSP9.1]WFA03515.1 type II CAAX endopeptidase family protein [Bacillus sp. HSf4]